MIKLGYGKNPVGYCKLHHKTLTAHQMRCKKCLAKRCFHLYKYNRHPFWRMREEKKRNKKARC